MTDNRTHEPNETIDELNATTWEDLNPDWLEDGDYESGPFCAHWSDFACDCQCGHTCGHHDDTTGECNDCDCKEFIDERYSLKDKAESAFENTK